MIKLENVTKTYQMGDTTVHALKGVSVSIEEGDFVAIMGPSGSGKSTLAHILGLLDVPSEGSYQLNGKEVSKLSEDELAELRSEEIGFIFQQFNLLPRMTAAENVALPLLYSHHEPLASLAQPYLEKVGLGTRSHHKPNELSGGQQQRVAIARSLMNKPRIILADEPTGNLDSQSEKEILKILKELNEQGITVIMVTHEEEIGEQAKRLIRMRDGVVQSDDRKVALKESQSKAVPLHALPKRDTRRWIKDVLEHFKQGFRVLAANKVRTALSMLGILIGVAAVVALLALGRGAQKQIEEQLSSLGSNLLVLRAGAVRVGGVAQESGATTRLTSDDVDALKGVPGIKNAGGVVNGRAQVAFENRNWSTQLQGVETVYGQMHASEVTIGRFFTPEENRMRARVAMVGATVVRELFGERNPLGEFIKINKISFQIIGILPAKGATGWRDQDDVVMIPVLTAMHRVLGKVYVDSIDLEVVSPDQMESTQIGVLDLMYSRKRVPLSMQKDAFQVTNMADIQAAVSQSSQTMSMLLAAIAAISLLVGGIGIMNIMIVSVTERTKEIGLRKAIGAKRMDILMQFLAEAVVVSGVGGAAGVLLAWLITFGVSTGFGMPASISAVAVVGAVLFSGFIGVLFGIYPAKKASELHPIQALRYE